jgi:hypothetical protein
MLASRKRPPSLSETESSQEDILFVQHKKHTHNTSNQKARPLQKSTCAKVTPSLCQSLFSSSHHKPATRSLKFGMEVPVHIKVRVHGLPTVNDIILDHPRMLTVGSLLEEVQRRWGQNVSFSFTVSGRQLDAVILKQTLEALPETMNNELDISLFHVEIVSSGPGGPRPGYPPDGCPCVVFVKKEEDEENKFYLNWSAINRDLPPELHVVPRDGGDGTKGCLRSSSSKRVFVHVLLDRTRFHDGHVWVEVNEVLSVGKNYRRATHACFLLIWQDLPFLTYVNRRGQKFVPLCLVPRLIELFGRPMTLEEMCNEYEVLVRRHRPHEPPAVVVIDRPRRPREEEEVLLDDAFHHMVAARQLFQGIAGPVEAEVIRGPMEQLERCLKRLRSHGETLGVAEDEKEMERAMEELTMAVGQGHFVIAILAAVIEGEPILPPGTIVAYSYRTGRVSARASAFTVEDGPLTYQVVVERERVDLLLDPQNVALDDRAVPLLLVGTVSGVSVHSGNVFPGCQVQAIVDDDQITVQPTALPPNDPLFVGTIERLDEGERMVTLRVDTYMWAETLLQDVLKRHK